MSELQHSCPVCGGHLNVPDLAYDEEKQAIIGAGVKEVRFSGAESRFFSVLWRSYRSGRIATKETVLHEMYFDDPEGGPLDPTNTLKVFLFKIRAKLRHSGAALEIVTFPGCGYQMRRAA